MTKIAVLISLLLCAPAFADEADIRAKLLSTPVWVYEWSPKEGVRGRVESGKVSFIEQDGKLIGVMDEEWRKCSNEVTLRADGFEWQNCRGYHQGYVRSGNEFKNTDGGWNHTFRPAP